MSNNFLEALLPLAAFGGTLAAGLNNNRVGPDAVQSGLQFYNVGRYWQYQQEVERQHRMTQLMQLADDAYKIGDVETATQLGQQIQALGGNGQAVMALARRYQRLGEEDDAAFAAAGVPGFASSPQIAVPPPPPPTTMTVPAPMAVPPPSVAPPSAPAGMPPTMPGTDLRNLYGQIWDLDAAIANAPSGSDERGQLIDRSLALAQQLPAQAVPPFPAAQDARAAAAAVTGERIPPLQRTPATADEPPAEDSRGLDLSGLMPPGSGVLATQTPVPGSGPAQAGEEQPVAEPHVSPPRAIPSASVTRRHRTRQDVSMTTTPEGVKSGNELAAWQEWGRLQEARMDPIVALQRMDRSGWSGYTKPLWEQAATNFYQQTFDSLIAQGVPDSRAMQIAFQRTQSVTGGKGFTAQDRTAFSRAITPDQLEFESQLTGQDSPEAIQSGLESYKRAQVEQAGRMAGEQAKQRTLETNKAEMEKSLELFPGGRAVWRKLDPGSYGTELVAPPSVETGSQARKEGYINVSAFEKQLDLARGLDDIFTWTGTLEKYANEIIKAEPGFWNMTGQAVRNTLAKWSNSDIPTALKTLDGSRHLTLGEVVNLYERELKGSQDFITRALGTVGTQTEGDVYRSARNFAGLGDTKAMMQQLFHDLRSRIFARRMSLLSAAFGERQVADAFPEADRSWDGRRSVPSTYTIPDEVEELYGSRPEISVETYVGKYDNNGLPRTGPPMQDQPSGIVDRIQKRLDDLYERARVR